MNIFLIPPDYSLIEEIIPHLLHEDRDYSANMVVFPGKRPSHFLRKAIAKRIKGSFIPPAILSIDGFIDFVYESLESKKTLDTIDAVALLYDIHRRSINHMGGSNFDTADRFLPVGLKIYRDIEELFIECIEPHRVKGIESFTHESVPEQTISRLQSLSFYYEGFYKKINEQGFSTRSSRYRIVSEDIEKPGIEKIGIKDFRRIIFAGFFALTEAEKRLFKGLMKKEGSVFLFQEGTGIGEQLLELGINTKALKGQCREGREGKEDKTGDARQDVHFYSAPDTHGQALALSMVFHQGLQKREELLNERTVIVLPSSETLFPLLRQGLSTIDDDRYNISMGYPLHRTPVYGFLNNLMELIISMDGEYIYIPDYLKFVLHPYTKNIYYNGSAEITRIIFHALEEELKEYRTRTFLTLKDIEDNRNLLQQIMDKIPIAKDKNAMEIKTEDIKRHLKTIHDSTIRKFTAFENIGDFTLRCKDVLIYILNNSTARLHPLFYPFSESLLNAFGKIYKSLMRDISFSEKSSYFNFLRRYIMTCHSPFEGVPVKGLQVIGFLETRNLKFDRVFIMDVNEDILPETKKEDSLLPFKAREMLGLPTYLEMDKIAEYYFDVLLKGAKEVHLFFIEDDKKERSRFVEKLIWEKQKVDRDAGIKDMAKDMIKTVQYKISLANKVPSDIKKTDEIIRFLKDYTYSPTALDTYLRCQLRFYYSHVMKLDRREDISGDIESADVGKFVHNALSRYFSKKKGYPLKEADINIREMALLIDRLFAERYGKNQIGAAYLLKTQIKDHLNDYLKRYYIPVVKTESVTIVDTELPVNIAANSFNLKGRIDCIERRGSRIFIIDYKTSSNPGYLKIDFNKLDIYRREDWNRAIGSLQLPFYLLIYSEYTGRKIKDLNGMFLLLGRSVINREIELPLFDNDATEKEYELLMAVIFKLLNEVVDVSVPFAPASDRKKSCPACDFQNICATQWVVK